MKAPLGLAAAYPMLAILFLAGCAPSQTPPTEFTCNAAQAWQNTGMLLHEGDRLTVQYENGQWTTDVRTGLAPPAGNPHTPGSKDDILPAAPRSALLGRVGESVFAIGNSFDAVVPAQGRLYCAINTNISRADGSQYLPSEGAVTMRAWITRAKPICDDPSYGLCLDNIKMPAF